MSDLRGCLARLIRLLWDLLWICYFGFVRGWGISHTSIKPPPSLPAVFFVLGRRFLGRRFLGRCFLGRRFLGHRFLARRFLGRRFLGHRFLGRRFLGRRFLGRCFLGSRFLGRRSSFSRSSFSRHPKFKQKTAEEVPLTGEKSVEIKEMLLVIYPTSTKLIGESICSFLLDLAKEYMRVWLRSLRNVKFTSLAAFGLARE